MATVGAMTSQGPLRRLGPLVREALVDPAPAAVDKVSTSRRRVVVAATVLVGAATMFWSLHIPAGDALFYPATFALAAVWILGAWLSGPVPFAAPEAPGRSRWAALVWLPVALGLALLLVFLLGAVVVAQIPLLAGPVQQLLDHVRLGSLGILVLVTAINGVSEEYFFRGALFQALPPRWQVAGSTAIYAAVTAVSGVPLLVLAGAMLGLLVALQRRATGGFVAGAVTHVVWSLGMLLLLPPTLGLAARLFG